MFEISQKQQRIGNIDLFGTFTLDLDLRYLGLLLLHKRFTGQEDVELEYYEMEA